MKQNSRPDVDQEIASLFDEAGDLIKGVLDEDTPEASFVKDAIARIDKTQEEILGITNIEELEARFGS